MICWNAKTFITTFVTVQKISYLPMPSNEQQKNYKIRNEHPSKSKHPIVSIEIT